MCGISGIVEGSNAEAVEPERLDTMCQTLCHRGPDGAGMYINGKVGLATQRLAIIDVPGGVQPVHNEDKTVYAVFNGEIYNYRSLREQLSARGHRFESESDSEVIPHLYEEYGTDLPAHLQGMFAVALWDEPRKQLLLFRDRVGVKPLYYAVDHGRLVFGSQIRAILAAGLNPTVNPHAISAFLSLMYIPGSSSIYTQVHKVEPGTVLLWRAGRCTSRRYWSLDEVSVRRDLTVDDCQQMLRELLDTSVAQQLMSDVPLGFFLSGGLDSSSIVAAARQIRPDGPIKTFSVGFTDRSYDERREAALVAARCRTEHTELVVEPRASDVVERILPSFDEPFADPSMVPTYYLCELARGDVTVALSGDGGDELFAGYLTYKADKLAAHYRRLPRALTAHLAPAALGLLPASDARNSFGFKARRFIDNALDEPARSHYLWRVVFGPAAKAKLLEPDLLAELDDPFEMYREHYQTSPFDALTSFQYADLKTYLADDVLVKVDRLSMAHSLEVRVPLLSEPVIEFAFSLPGRLKMPGYQPKQLVRRAMADRLPPAITRMGKKGFNAPLPRWLRGVFRPLVDEFLSTEVLRRQGYFRHDEVHRLINHHMDGTAENSREIWMLLMFSIWAEKYRVYR